MTARVAGDDGMVEALRARRNKGKEPIEREAMQDGRLSMKARGILGYLVSKPDKWRTNAKAIADECERDGRDSISTGLKELEEKGYLARKRRKKADGTFAWCWIYSDDPAEVAEVLEELFPDGSGRKPDLRRGRARTTRLGGEPAGQAMNGFPVHGQPGEPAGQAINGFSVDGSSVHGSSVDGGPVDIESEREIDPPNPPRSGGDEGPPGRNGRRRCDEHGVAGCRRCGLSVRAPAQTERAAAATAEQIAKACTMCALNPTGRWLRTLPGQRAVVLTPFIDCDHVTPHDRAVAAAEAAEEAAERARTAARSAPPVPGCSPASSAVARAALEEVRARKRAARSADTSRQDAGASSTGEVASRPAGGDSRESVGG